jgi:tRNA (guanine37-N1)-methyltransferase
MHYSVLTIFPGLVESFKEVGLIQKAIDAGLIGIDAVDLRAYSGNKHRKVDDRPFGGGAGMVMTPGPLFSATRAILDGRPGRVILLSAYAERFTQVKAKALAREPHLVLVCGRYEGVDQRYIDSMVDEELSIGEFVLMGGEVAAMTVMEAVSRMIPGVVGNQESVETDSFFFEGQYGFPQYTQPRDYQGVLVPEVLTSGHHREIIKWRKERQKRGDKG